MKDTEPTPFAAETAEPADLELALRVAIELCHEGICLIEPNGEVIFANQVLVNWLEKRSKPAANRSIWDWLPTAEEAGFRNQLARIILGEAEEATFVGQFLAGDGSQLPLELRIRCVGSEPAAMLAIVARQKLIDEHDALSSQSVLRNDPLTGLADRDALMYRLEAMLNRAADNRRFALLFIDVDEFKQVNDRFGHLVGDQVLREVAQRLSGCVRSGDQLARFGGDEFVILLDGIGSSGGGIRAVVDRICAAFKPKFSVPDDEVQMSVSIGVAEPSVACTTAEDLLHAADQAMYAAKRSDA
jgi:diguanylate cyclase (GGDEF)-like protein